MELWAKNQDSISSYGINSHTTTQVKQKAEKQQTRLLNCVSSLSNLPGPTNAQSETSSIDREQPVAPKSAKAGVKKVNDFLYKTTFFAGDLSGTQMFDPKLNNIFGMPKGPVKVYARD